MTATVAHCACGTPLTGLYGKRCQACYWREVQTPWLAGEIRRMRAGAAALRGERPPHQLTLFVEVRDAAQTT